MPASRLARFAVRAWGIDLRAVAAFRVAIGLILLQDSCVRGRDVTTFYSDSGVLPRADFMARFPYQADLTLLMISGSPYVMGLLFVVAAALAIAVAVGWRTRWTVPALWVMTTSIQYRNPLVNFGAEDFIRLMLFWLMFLPHEKRHGAHDEKPAFSIGSVAALAQVCMIYLFAGLLKTGPEWRTTHTAIYYALGQESSVRPFGQWMRTLPDTILGPMTAGVWWLEAAGWLLLFSPIAFLPLRLLGIAAFVGMHVGFGTTMSLGLFPVIGAASMLLFVPKEVWDRLQKTSYDATQAVTSALQPRALLRFQVLPAIALAYVVIINLRTLPEFKQTLAMPRPLQTLDWLRIDQGWTMFAPSPGRRFGHYVMPGRLRDGTAVDAYTYATGTPSWDRPANLYEWYGSIRWSQYMMSLWITHNKRQYELLAGFLCKTWNDGFPYERQLESLKIWYVLSESKPRGEPETPERQLMVDWRCPGGPAQPPQKVAH